MRRKVIQQGRVGCTINLPIDWVRENRLKPGSDVTINNFQGNLLISSGPDHLKKEVHIRLKAESESYIRMLLNNLYRSGYDRIHIFTQRQHMVEKIAKQYLIGCEVIERKRGYLLLECIAEPAEEKQNSANQRLFLIIKEAMQVIRAAMDVSDISSMQRVAELTASYGQCDNVCRRNLYVKRVLEGKKFFYWGMYTYLHLIQHNLLHLSETMVRNHYKIPSEFICFFDGMQELFQTMYQGYLKKDRSLVERVNKKAQHLNGRLLAEMQTSKGSDTQFLYYGAEFCRLVYLLSSPLIAITMNQIGEQS